MSKFKVLIEWRQESYDYSYEQYNRHHFWKFRGGALVEATAAPEFKGDPRLINPEEAYIASLASCHMLTFLAIASLKNIQVIKYEDNAEGVLGKNSQGKMAMVKVILKPYILFGKKHRIGNETLIAMHNKAHRECFISNSVASEMIIEPVFDDL